MAAIIQNIGEFPFFVQVAMGIWVVLIILSALVFLTCLGLLISDRGEKLKELTISILVGFIWSIVGIGLTYVLGAFL
jgi:hypothetical protein